MCTQATLSASQSDVPRPEAIVFRDGVAALQNEGAYAVMAAATVLEQETGHSVVHLEIGQPGFPTPAAVCEAASAAIAAGKTKYVAPAGITPLRAKIAALTAARAGVEIDPAQVVIGPGAKPGLFFAALALVRGPEDEIVVPDPGFPTYTAMAQVAGATIRPVRLGTTLQCYDMAKLKAAVSDKTRIVILNSPSNPTGGVASLSDLEEIAALSKEYGFYVISDEIYAQLTYSDDDAQDCPSILSITGMADRTIVVDGFSKTWSMTGWRLGWAVVPAALALRLELLLVHAVGCTASFVQEAGLVALESGYEDVAAMREEYRRRRDLVVSGLNMIHGVYCRCPEGAFYAFADVSAFGRTSKEIADLILNDGFCAVLPGTDFGEGGEGFIRLSYVSEPDVLREGLKRIANVLSTLPVVRNPKSLGQLT
jgi:aspartate aminotransferase